MTPLVMAVVISLLIHGSLLAIIAAKFSVRRQTDAARLIVGTDSSHLRFVATTGDDGGGGGDVGHATDDGEVQTQTERIAPPLVAMSETPLPANDGPTDSLPDSLETTAEARAAGSVAKSAVGIPRGDSSSAGGGNGRTAAYARNPLPPYPREARERGWQGTTLLRVEVLADGIAGKIEVAESSGHLILDEACTETVRGWKFSPARSGDAPIRSVVEIPISFRLVQ
jgi:TonB family protein